MITKENIWEEIKKKNYLEILKSDFVDQVKNDNGWTPLHRLARYGVKKILSHPSVDKVKDKDGWTPLHYLALYSYLTKEDLKKRFPWYKKEIKDIKEAVDEMVNTPTSIRFILED